MYRADLLTAHRIPEGVLSQHTQHSSQSRLHGLLASSLSLSWETMCENPCSELKCGQILTHPTPTSTDSLTRGLHELTFIHKDRGKGPDLSYWEPPGSGSSKQAMVSSVCSGGRAG